jgi:SAM-dependent methyltransferase
MASSPSTSAPLPPRELAQYILGMPELEDAVEVYERQGREIAGNIRSLLGGEWSFDGKRVLDFGCGAGRVLRQFVHETPRAELCGCDIDEACIAWLQENLVPPLEVIQNADRPPLPWPDAHFDLVWATSVFTHVAEHWAAWLLELHRLLKPEGLLIASVMGHRSSELIADEPWDPDRIGMNVFGYGRPWHAGGPMILHSEWWLRGHWGRAFDLLDFRVAGLCGQDATLWRRRELDRALSPQDLEAPTDDLERELAAARHAVTHLHRENSTLNTWHDRAWTAYREETRLREDREGEIKRLQQRLEELEQRLQGAGRQLGERTRPGRTIDRWVRAVRRRPG